MNKKKVIVGISGGVDSSVSAWLLKKQGYHVEGLFMKNWEEDDNNKYCNAKKDLEDAITVCKQLNIFLHKINFSIEYWDHVFQKCIDEYLLYKTPNPDILCNKKIKFNLFLNFAIKELKSDYIATGHYVRKNILNNKTCLLRGIDLNKDQSYFLYTLSYKILEKCLFPIGNLTKSYVRILAKKINLITANKKDSTGICFIGKRKFKEFISNYLPSIPGIILSTKGEKVGNHDGLMYYTLGQRKGLKIGGVKNYKTKPWYVVKKDIINNILIVSQKYNHPYLVSKGLIIEKYYFVNREIYKSIICTVKIRYRQPDIECILFKQCKKYLKILFKTPVLAATPGQSAVFYIKDYCIGGGIIKYLIKN